jgi:hypothetical protein
MTSHKFLSPSLNCYTIQIFNYFTFLMASHFFHNVTLLSWCHTSFMVTLLSWCHTSFTMSRFFHDVTLRWGQTNWIALGFFVGVTVIPHFRLSMSSIASHCSDSVTNFFTHLNCFERQICLIALHYIDSGTLSWHCPTSLMRHTFQTASQRGSQFKLLTLRHLCLKTPQLW